MKKFRCEFASWLALSSWPSSNGDWCSHISVGQNLPARTNISKCRDVLLLEFCFVSFPVNIRFCPPLLSSASFTAKCHRLPIIKFLLTVDLEYISTCTYFLSNSNTLLQIPTLCCKCIVKYLNTSKESHLWLNIFGLWYDGGSGHWPTVSALQQGFIYILSFQKLLEQIRNVEKLEKIFLGS